MEITDISHIKDLRFIISCDAPQTNLYAFSGCLDWYDLKNEHLETPDMKIPLGINNLLLRGCILKNTEWVLGIIVYSGNDTKITMNSGVTPFKRSQLEWKMNRFVLWNLVLLFILCVITTAAYSSFEIRAGLTNPQWLSTPTESQTSSWFITNFL